MPYDESLAARIDTVLKRKKGLDTKKMFGGIAWMVNGHMACGIVQDKLMVRVGPDAYDDCLKEKHTTPMDFTGKALKGIAFARSLPPKND